MKRRNEERLGVVKNFRRGHRRMRPEFHFKTKGVYGLSGGLTDSLSKNLLGKDPLYKGIKISQGDDGVVIDISVIVNYGIKIPDVAWDIQENVKKEVEEIIEITVNAVNIHVTGVHFNEA